MTEIGDDRQAQATGPTSPRQQEAFWTLFVALPAAFSILRLWVESGGQLQTMLLLVSNVSATNLIAAMLITGTPLVTAGIIAVVAIGSVLEVSAEHASGDDQSGSARSMLVRFTRALPDWFIAATFVLAFATWKILYLPLLAPAAMVTIQRTKWYRELDDPRLIKRTAAYLVAITAYGWLVLPAIRDAWANREFMAVMLLVIPMLLVPAVTGPLHQRLAKLLSLVSPPILLVLLVLGAIPVFQTPVLPLTITVTDNSKTGDADLFEYIRGHVIYTDDVNTVILQEKGGVRYIRNPKIREQVLCSTADELPRYRLRIQDFHVEDSLLRALGRRVRPITTTDAACRVGPSSRDRSAVP